MKELNKRSLRTPQERVGPLPNADLPPPAVAGNDHEALLLRALRDGDEQSFSRALDRNYASMLRVALTHVSSQEAAEDVVQEAWMAALRGFAGFEGRSSVRTWLYRILRNIARARGKRDARMGQLSDLVGDGGEERDPMELIANNGPASPGTWQALAGTIKATDAQVLEAELGEQLRRAIAKLPGRQRELLLLRDVDGWSAEDACNALGLSKTNQRVLLHRARERVRLELRDYVGDGRCIGDEADDLR